MCRHLGVQEALQDAEAKDLSTDTAVESIATEVKQSLASE